MSSRLKHVAHYAYFVAPNASGTLKAEIPREVREMGLESTIPYHSISIIRQFRPLPIPIKANL